ncbi:GNAT family N-acetyltransferase [Actinospica durhamensis]|uniref:GNAT family N-acetyltransferase n=1 Tax=Actinospica durhamensis TaxID=1508375 RepID=A0A941IQH9_9ACTN|nr:GNAT family N-acetyltransferase [Actinospica durhamensis]MBR7837675.1 GNAT family N-acetyltransferase [Actinospica durhamensis]
MDTKAVLELFDRRLRRDHPADGPGDVVERVGAVVRQVGAGDGWTGVLWSDFGGADGDDAAAAAADAAIAEQIGYFTGLDREFEWKLYSHDRPADLGGRLAAAGFMPDEPETVLVGAVADLPTEPEVPEGVRLLKVTDVAGVELMMQVHDEAFGRPSPRLHRHLLHQVAHEPDAIDAVLVLAGDRPVCAARTDFHQGTEFASLWGGGTVPQWRGRGIYRATVAYRTALAAARGYQYLQVDASDQSRPILERLGFHALATTTPYTYTPH